MRRRSRSWRRSQTDRIRKKAYRALKAAYTPFYADVPRDNRFLKMEARKRADHLRTCSCALCYSKSNRLGRRRDLTLEELRSIKNLQEGVEEYHTNEEESD